MRTVMVAQRIGEHLGDIDWMFPFEDQGWDRPGGSVNPDHIQKSIRNLSRLDDLHRAGKEVFVTTDGGCPKGGWGRLLEVGMYDGWPYWKPHPSFLMLGPLGPEWHGYTSIMGIKEVDGE